MNKQEIEEAIVTVINLKDRYWETDTYTVLNDTVLPMLYQQLTNGWIPVSSGRMPEKEGWYKTSDISSGKDHPMVCDGYWNGYKFVDYLDEEKECEFELKFVTAWKTEDEPYKEESHGETK